MKIPTIINKHKPRIIILLTSVLLYACTVQSGSVRQEVFLAQRAFEDVQYQTSLGPRVPGSRAHDLTVDWIVDEVEESGWMVEVQELTFLGKDIKNVIAKNSIQNLESEPWIILGAHYDTRLVADRDRNPEHQLDPVLGANDGASGVAVLLELSRILPEDLKKNIWLVFFDAEDNGDIAGWQWAQGSQAFVDNLEGKPDQVVIVDMVGDADLNVYMEKNSNLELTQEIWAKAAELGYSNKFIPTPKYSLIDDHLPFIYAGITAIDIIDFDYPYWHTSEDTLDKVSPQSLKTVGDVLMAWLVD